MYAYQTNLLGNLPREYLGIPNIDIKNKRKILKKVSKYRDKSGIIKVQVEECKEWLNKNIFGEYVTDIYKECYNNLLMSFQRMMFANARRRYRNRLKDLKNGKYIKSRLSSIFKSNKLYFDKLYKKDGIQIYSYIDVCEFMLLLIEAKKQNRLYQFIDIPVVFYITRQIKAIGLNYYLM